MLDDVKGFSFAEALKIFLVMFQLCSFKRNNNNNNKIKHTQLKPEGHQQSMKKVLK